MYFLRFNVKDNKNLKGIVVITRESKIINMNAATANQQVSCFAVVFML